MSKIFQIVDGVCAWHTSYKSVAETIGKYPVECLFVEAPDYVFKGWEYRPEDKDGNPIDGDACFVKPTPPEGYIYDDSTGEFVPDSESPKLLAKVQEEKQNENKAMFLQYLEEHPITWVDGKTYGVSLDDQSEIQLNLSQYQLQVAAGVENPILEWHASHESCIPWTIENLTALALTISAYIYPWFQLMNVYKSKIYNSTTREEVLAIELVYDESVI